MSEETKNTPSESGTKKNSVSPEELQKAIEILEKFNKNNNSDPEAVPADTVSSDSKEKQRSFDILKKWKIIIVFAVLILVSSIVCYFLFGKGNSSVPASCDNFPDCSLTVATIGDYFIKGDIDGSLSLSPEGLLNNETEPSVFLNWIRKLLYPSIVQYSVDEFNQLTANTEYFQDYRSIHFELDGIKSIDPGFVSQEERTHDSFRFRVDFSQKAENYLCADNFPLVSPLTLERPIKAIKNTIQNKGIVESDIKINVNDRNMIVDIATQTGGNFVIYDLILGHLSLFRFKQGMSNLPVPCGIFNFAENGVNVSEESIDVVLNPKGYGVLPGSLNKSCCINDDGTDRSPKVCFRRYTSLTQAVEEDAKFDILIAPYNPYKQFKDIKMPSSVEMRTLPVGTHFYAVVNSQSISDKNERIYIYKDIIVPAVREIIKKELIDIPENDVSPYWFPTSWKTTRNVEVKTDIENFKYSSIQGSASSLNMNNLTILVTGPENSSDIERNPLLKEIVNKLNSIRINYKIIDDKDGNWSAADLVLFTSRYDTLFGDPTNLILSHSSAIRVLAPNSNGEWEQKLKNASRRILLSGQNSMDVIQFVMDVQKEFVEDAFIFPIFIIPYHVFYKNDIFKHIEMNYREGFINFDKWQINSKERCFSGESN